MKRRASSLAFLLLLAGFAAALQWYLSRPDRRRAVVRLAEMVTVRDQLLRFELEYGRLPETLGELVPHYLQGEQLQTEDGQRYHYDPAARTLAEARGAPIRSLFSWTRAPRTLALPERDGGPPVPAPGTGRSMPTAEAGLAGPTLPPPPSGALVFEAEHFTEMNYGWESHPDPAASGGAYLHCKEGLGNGPGQTGGKMGDFYNVRATRAHTVLRYHLHLPQGGTWYVYGRMWTTDTHCSNAVNAAFDQGGPGVGLMENRLPFQWLWSPLRMSGLGMSYGERITPPMDPVLPAEPVDLTAGDHYLHIFMWEDGLRFDQFILSPRPLQGGTPFAANFHPGADTAWQARPGPPVAIGFDLASLVFADDRPPACAITLRRLRPGTGQADLTVTLHGAGTDGGDLLIATRTVSLAAGPAVTHWPVPFPRQRLAALARREYLLSARVEQNGTRLDEVHVPLMKPFHWETFGPLPYLANGEAGPLDGEAPPPADSELAWTPLPAAHLDAFGVLDFGLQTSGNSLHAPRNATLYARTRICVPKTETVLLKYQSDDQMLVWIDGEVVVRNNSQAPVTRAGHTRPIRLEAGNHRVRLRVNQRGTRWQASLRFRTQEDTASAITGLPLR